MKGSEKSRQSLLDVRMKVIIADDETKICQLIFNLVNWEELDMEVVAIVNDGIEALEAMEAHSPDIVITDIRMPGYDGLELIERGKAQNPNTEFIIISGYRHFEYAQNAIRYGVRDYLLKPVRKVELVETLTKMHINRLKKDKSITAEEEYKNLMVNSIDKLRNTFLQETLFNHHLSKKDLIMNDINEEYHFHFQPGVIQVVIVKIDGIDSSMNSESDYIQEKVLHTINKKIKGLCYELESLFDHHFCYMVLNYDIGNKKEIRHGLKSILDDLLLQKDILNNLSITIGLGDIQDSIQLISDSKKTAKWAIEQRLVIGTNKIIDPIMRDTSELAYSMMFNEFNKRYTNAIERLNESDIMDALTFLEEKLRQKENITGYEILQMSREAMNLYLFTMRKNRFSVLHGDRIFEAFSHDVENQGSLVGIIDLLSKTVITSFRESYEMKKLEENKPIREAKDYIRKNLNKSISLDQVSAHIGFNASYFSSLFKKETGSTFSEYIIQVRMEKTKELLKETEWNIAVICEEVGYSDLKNFTKNFKKYTGLRPNEYRKIYS